MSEISVARVHCVSSVAAAAAAAAAAAPPCQSLQRPHSLGQHTVHFCCSSDGGDGGGGAPGVSGFLLLAPVLL